MPFFIWWCKWCAKCYAHETFAHFSTLISLRTALRSSSVRYVAGLLCKHCTPDLRQRCAQSKLRPTLYNVAQLLALYCSLVWQYWAQRFSQCYTRKLLHKRSALYFTYLAKNCFSKCCTKYCAKFTMHYVARDFIQTVYHNVVQCLQNVKHNVVQAIVDNVTLNLAHSVI